MNSQEVHVPRHAHRADAKRGKRRDMDGGDRHEFHEFHEFYGLCGFHLPREGPHGALRLTRPLVTLTYEGHSFSVDDDAQVCEACDDELMGERAAAFLLAQRALAPDAEKTVTVRRRTESV